MSGGVSMQELDPRPPLWMRKAILGMGVFTIGYAGFIIGDGIALPLAAGATLCERLAFLMPVFMGLIGMMLIVMGTELREVADP
ncbi:hypothetical protein [Halococcus sp. AFM35]|uniref:hypothetical protein n=1 Tax=Halococcus sp. AFM35 TaxID=3421653 RepID=UPI003EB6A27B